MFDLISFSGNNMQGHVPVHQPLARSDTPDRTRDLSPQSCFRKNNPVQTVMPGPLCTEIQASVDQIQSCWASLMRCSLNLVEKVSIGLTSGQTRCT